MDDDEVQVTGSKGDIALRDYPHLRCQCIVVRFSLANAAAHCQLCFCYVCDLPVAQCSSWSTHCRANPALDAWKVERARMAAQRATINSMPKRISLADVCRVYPHQADASTATPLHTAQKQMLAFALATERDGVSLDDVLYAKTTDVPVPVRVHGGFISAEMGVGKSGVICALVLAKPVPTLVVVPPLTLQQWAGEFAKFTPTLRVVAAGSYRQGHRCAPHRRELNVSPRAPDKI